MSDQAIQIHNKIIHSYSYHNEAVERYELDFLTTTKLCILTTWHLAHITDMCNCTRKRCMKDYAATSIQTGKLTGQK